MRTSRALAVIAVLALAGTAHAQDEDVMGLDLIPPAVEESEATVTLSPSPNIGYGPLRTTSMSPFQSLRVGFMPRTPKSHVRGQWTIGESFTWANQWAHQGDEYLLDFESLRTAIAVAYDVSDSIEVGLTTVQKQRFGGGGDGFIQRFHDVFGLGQDGRDERPRGDYAFRVGETSGRRGTFMEYLVASVLHTVTRGDEAMPALAWSFTMRTELADSPDFEQDEPVDLSFTISASKGFGHFYASVTAGIAYFGSEEFQGIALRRTMVSALAAIEWRFGEAMSIVVQYLFSQGVAENLGELSEPSNEILLGWKGDVGRGALLEIGLVENLITFDNSPDFGVHVGVSYRR